MLFRTTHAYSNFGVFKINTVLTVKKMSMGEISAKRKKEYREEVWKRYQEYQKVKEI